jgi:aspartate/tyrosine/aromatic aminotransferase
MDFDKVCREITEMPEGSTILLHACCHNPTGIDPTNEQWKILSSIIQKQKVIPFFDFAYQGFKKSIDDDAFAIRYFVSQGHELLVANSFAKNFGLYGERVGTLSIVTPNKEAVKKIGSQVKQLIRGNYSSPPRRGSEIIKEILNSEELKNTWLKELANMRDRLVEMRHTLISGLQAKRANHQDWSFLNHQSGFFSFCGLTEGQVHRLIKDYAIYLPANGRINVAGLNGHNMDYVIDAILEVTQT